jgi:hypothetical protein
MTTGMSPRCPGLILVVSGRHANHQAAVEYYMTADYLAPESPAVDRGRAQQPSKVT